MAVLRAGTYVSIPGATRQRENILIIGQAGIGVPCRVHRDLERNAVEPALEIGLPPRYSGSNETCADTIRQPSGKRTQTWLWRPRTTPEFVDLSNSSVMLAKSRPKLT